MRISLVNMPQHSLRRLLLAAVALMVVFASPTYAAAPAAKHAGGAQPDEKDIAVIRDQVTRYWNVRPGLPDVGKVHVRIRLKLDRSGQIVGHPGVEATGGPQQTRNAVASSALRAVLKSAPFGNLPRDKYDAWREVTLNFDLGGLAL